MTKVRVRFYGPFQHITGKKKESIELAEATLEGLAQALERSYGPRFTQVLRDSQKQLSPGGMVLVNGKQFSGWETRLARDDEVIFFFAMAGG